MEDNKLEKTDKDVNNTTPAPAEEKPTVPDLSALEARIKQLESENGKLRQSVTNASADASEWKKKYQSQISDEQKAKEEQEAYAAAMQAELENLRKEKNIANFKGVLISQDIGMDAETAGSVAEALNSGNHEEVFAGLRKFIAVHDKDLKENAFRNNPTLTGGADTGKPVSKEKFDAMNYTERLAVFEKYPDLYKEYTKK